MPPTFQTNCPLSTTTYSPPPPNPSIPRSILKVGQASGLFIRNPCLPSTNWKLTAATPPKTCASSTVLRHKIFCHPRNPRQISGLQSHEKYLRLLSFASQHPRTSSPWHRTLRKPGGIRLCLVHPSAARTSSSAPPRLRARFESFLHALHALARDSTFSTVIL